MSIGVKYKIYMFLFNNVCFFKVFFMIYEDPAIETNDGCVSQEEEKKERKKKAINQKQDGD